MPFLREQELKTEGSVVSAGARVGKCPFLREQELAKQEWDVQEETTDRTLESVFFPGKIAWGKNLTGDSHFKGKT